MLSLQRKERMYIIYNIHAVAILCLSVIHTVYNVSNITKITMPDISIPRHFSGFTVTLPYCFVNTEVKGIVKHHWVRWRTARWVQRCGLNHPGMYATVFKGSAGPTYCKLLDLSVHDKLQRSYTIISLITAKDRNSYCQCLL